jgi:uncharacterized protein YcbX
MSARVAALWRYPVKSMLGERVAAAEVTDLGLAGDRRWAVLDRETGKVASAKLPRLWRALPACAVTSDGAGVRITTPDGATWFVGGRAHETVDGTDLADGSGVSPGLGGGSGVSPGLGGGSGVSPGLGGGSGASPDFADGPGVSLGLADDTGASPGLDKALSAFLGRDVALIHVPPRDGTLDRSRPEEVLDAGIEAEVAADVVQFGSASPPGTFFDFAPLHLITTATLRRLAALSPRGTVEAERYRPNLVLDTDGDGFDEDAWVGRELRVGDEVVLRVIASTPRCAVPTLAHGSLPRDPDALRLLAVHHRIPALPGRAPEPCAGVYAQVIGGGLVREGDSVFLSTGLSNNR